MMDWPTLGRAMDAFTRAISCCHLATWLASVCFTIIPALNTRGPERLAFLALFLGAQAVFFNNLAAVVWFDDTLARFFGFTIFKLVLHITYVVLIEDVHLARPDGTWNWTAGWYVLSNPRRIHGLLPVAAADQTKQDQSRAETAEKDMAATNGAVAAEDKALKPQAEHVEVAVPAPAPAPETPKEPAVTDTILAWLLAAQAGLARLSAAYGTLSLRTRFLVRRGAYILLVLVPFVHLLHGVFDAAGQHLRASDFAPHKDRLWPRLLTATRRDWAHRSYLLIMFLCFPSTVMSLCHNVTAFLCVALGLSGADDWPLLFGPLSSSTSLRGYWGRTWHRIFSEPALMWAKWAAARLGLRRGGLAYGLFVPGTIFALSSVMHGVIETRFGWCGTTMDFALPMLNFAGILAEQVFQFAVGRALGRGFWARHRCLCAVVGYVWVYMFMVEVLPMIDKVRTRCFLTGSPQGWFDAAE